MNEIVQHAKPVSLGYALVPQSMDQAVTLARAMASAKMVPQHLQGDVGSCLMVVEQAMRWNMSPFAVAQCTSNVRGKMMYEGKLVAAACEAVGAIDGHFDYAFDGGGDDRKCVVSATRRGETEPKTVEVKLRDVKTENDSWKKQPDQQLVYSGTRNWARRWTPAVMLGVYAPEEFGRNMEQAPPPPHSGPTIEAEPEPAPPAAPAKPKRTYKELLEAIALAAKDAPTEEEVVALGETADVQLIFTHANEGVREELSQILSAAMARVRGDTPDVGPPAE